MILCLCKCCFWCLEKFMKFINRSVSLMRASLKPTYHISGTPTSSLLPKGVTSANLQNKLSASFSETWWTETFLSRGYNFSFKVRVAVLDKVTDFLLFLGKLVVTAAVALLSFLYFSGGINTSVSCSANIIPEIWEAVQTRSLIWGGKWKIKS